MILEKEYTKKVSVTHRKKFAQFFTPEPIAQIMVDWLLKENDFSTFLDPAFGLGIFSRLALQKKVDIEITGFDVDPIIFNAAERNFLNCMNINLKLEDYLFNDWNNKYDRIVCNPPYLKFHDYDSTNTLNEMKKKLNFQLSGFTNIYALFLLKSIYQLNDKGRIAYIIPSEFLNSDYGKNIKEYLIKSNLLRHIFIFDFKENVFDNALTTSAILLLANDTNTENVYFSTITKRDELGKITEAINAYPERSGQISIAKGELDSKIKWRGYYQKQNQAKYKDLIAFRNIAKVVRGIATGGNKYFIFNQSKSQKHKIIKKCLLPCITKSKDVNSPFFTKKDFEQLIKNDSNIYLIDAIKEKNDKNIIKYIELGEQEGVNEKYLTSKRTPWYSLENRPPSPIWVGVFNRKGIKFVRNEANIHNLTTFHCVYINEDLFNTINIDLLFAYLLTNISKQIFNDNRREYGGGLKKFEPNDLNNALMLNLSSLSRDEVDEILELYSEYRNAIINNRSSDHIDKINKILLNKYKA